MEPEGIHPSTGTNPPKKASLKLKGTPNQPSKHPKGEMWGIRSPQKKASESLFRALGEKPASKPFGGKTHQKLGGGRQKKPPSHTRGRFLEDPPGG